MALKIDIKNNKGITNYHTISNFTVFNKDTLCIVLAHYVDATYRQQELQEAYQESINLPYELGEELNHIIVYNKLKSLDAYKKAEDI